ncbi:SLAP domain-containing protein [Brevibacillus fulvus]|uniref:SLAP domain-containing protein n=1 Tax=Brevibacillus fulvus TaxID=1125967 RepID=A0A938Y5B0_9BACL|nr:SLAP domain-containing protein [Brevibacillus fulvus]MBM7591520.1 SLAP domain-containing protein [Brevibacillus fulvus]
MSWLLENWFGSKESLAQVREEIHEYMGNETYLGLSGIESPEQSANRVASKELFLTLHGPWGSKLDEMEAELLTYIYEQLPPVVRDEVGIIPFYANPLEDGYLVLTFIRNATDHDILINKLPLTLVTPDGDIVARKTFDMLSFGEIGDFSSRPCEFLFHWNDFLKVPDPDVELRIVCEPSARKRPTGLRPANRADGLTEQELAQYNKLVHQEPVTDNVIVKVLDIKAAEAGGLRVVVLFRNGFDQGISFTEVPLVVKHKNGAEVARVRFGLRNMRVSAKGHKIWSFHIPEKSLKDPNVDPAECIAVVPEVKSIARDVFAKGSKGLIQ